MKKHTLFPLIISLALSFFILSCGNGNEDFSSSFSYSGDISRYDEREYHIVKFDTDGGTLIPDQRILHGEKIVKPDDPYKEGFKFQYWQYLDKEWSFFEYSVMEDMTLTSIYSPIIDR